MPCYSCNAGFHTECHTPAQLEAEGPGNHFYTCCCNTVDRAPSFPVLDTSRVQKADEDIKDQTSTGRKRAAAMYPITDGMVCEWAGLKYAGGGAIPIVGCEGNLIAQTKRPIEENGKVTIWPGAIHHGPDKSTLNNTQNNVHRICVNCHNRWHAMNDPMYAKDRPPNGDPFLPLSGELIMHDSDTKATEEEIAWSNEYWKTKQRENLPYRLDV